MFKKHFGSGESKFWSTKNCKASKPTKARPGILGARSNDLETFIGILEN
jgi:hypothetical protein